MFLFVYYSYTIDIVFSPQLLLSPLRFSDPQLTDIGAGFDQEAGAVLMARLCMFQMTSMIQANVLRRMDRVFIRLISKFASYNKNDPASFQLAEEFTLFPQVGSLL